MIQSQKKRIGKTDYKVTQLTATEGRRVFVRLVKMLGPALANASETENVLNAFAGVLSNLSVDDMDYFCDKFGGSSWICVEDREMLVTDQFAIHFAGNYLEMMQWLAFCVEVNFGDFFAVLRAKFAPPATPPVA